MISQGPTFNGKTVPFIGPSNLVLSKTGNLTVRHTGPSSRDGNIVKFSKISDIFDFLDIFDIHRIFSIFSFLHATAYMLSAHMLSQFRPSVRPFVTGGSVKNG